MDRVGRFCEDCVLVRSLAGSAAATSLYTQFQAQKKRPAGRFFHHTESTDHFSTTAPFIIELWPGNEQKNS
jgi:hypothetical protein